MRLSLDTQLSYLMNYSELKNNFNNFIHYDNFTCHNNNYYYYQKYWKSFPAKTAFVASNNTHSIYNSKLLHFPPPSLPVY